MKILLVEDDELLAGVVAEFLTDHLHVVDVVSDGESAWNQIITLEYDLILLDVVMPEMNGIDFVKMVKTIPAYYFVPIIMITIKRDTETRNAALDAGGDPGGACRPRPRGGGR